MSGAATFFSSSLGFGTEILGLAAITGRDKCGAPKFEDYFSSSILCLIEISCVLRIFSASFEYEVTVECEN